MSFPYAVKPLPNDGTRGNRMEIDEFVEDNEMTNLFLVALSNLQKGSLNPVKNDKNKDIPNWLNYYAAASIHGAPTENWNGVTNPQLDGYGYCHHGLDSFPIWHRPYMAFYEGIIYNEMVRIAEKYPLEQEKKIYKAAVARFRLPFWDIVMPRNEFKSGEKVNTVWGTPKILASPNVFVKLPQPTPKADSKGFDTIPNPLYSFTFPTPQEREAANKNPSLKRTVLQMPQGYHSEIKTIRRPSSLDQTDDKALDYAIQSQASSFATTLIHMLNPDQTASEISRGGGSGGDQIAINELRDWSSFATHTAPDGSTPGLGKEFGVVQGKRYPTVSVESWHDRIHGLIGAAARQQDQRSFAGHLGNPQVAAFDPMFWMHHNNIERILCLHQAIYPKKYLDNTQAGKDLTPFLSQDDGSKFWKASDKWIKDYWNSGYATPGAKEPQADPASVRAELKKYLSATYLWAANNTAPELAKWPRDLSTSWALRGSEAKIREAPVLHISAMSTSSSQAHLVERTVALATLDGPEELEVAAPVDDRVRSAAVLGLTDHINKALPDGALENLTEKDKPTYQTTWNAHVRVRKYAFDGSFNVHLFIGYVKDDQPERYMTKKNEAGFTGVFATPTAGMEGCANCATQRDKDIYIEDTIPLTSFLYDYLTANPGSDTLIRDAEKKTIDDLSPEQVVPFLKENLDWRMIDLGNHLLQSYQDSGLEILVSHRTYLAPDQEHLLGQYGPFVPHPDITSGKAGGWGHVYTAA